MGDRRASKGLDGKGNVLVSVRVRPDVGNNSNSSPEGEWLVDGRKSLIAYRGREGGDYYYGKHIQYLHAELAAWLTSS